MVSEGPTTGGDDDLGRLEGLAEEVERPPLHGGDRRLDAPLGCHDDNRQLRALFPRKFQELEAVPLGHVEVDQDHPGQPPLDLLEAFLDARGVLRFNPRLP